MKLFQDSRSTSDVEQIVERIEQVCRQLCTQYNIQQTDKQLALTIERQADKTQHRVLVANTLWALSFVVTKQWLKAHIFPATNLIANKTPETAMNQRLSVRVKGTRLLLDDQTDVDEQLDLLILSLFEEVVRRSQAAAHSGTKGRLTLDDTSVMTAVRNLVHENQTLISQLLQQNEQIHNHIAADIHDQVISDLMLLKKMLQKRNAAEEEMQLVDDATNYLRDICSGLSGKDLQTFGLMPCLKNLVQKLRRHTEMKIEFEQSGDIPQLPENVSLQVFRIVQEALNNATKHSQANTIKVSISGNTSSFAATVLDDGVGIQRSSENPGLGLSLLVERANLINQTCRAQLAVTPATPQGTRVSLLLQL
jgi:signal transduction histidine kinase